MSEFVTREEMDEALRNQQTWVEHWFQEVAASMNLKLPIIQEGYWCLWDYDANQYIRTNHPARGPMGAKGKNGGLFPDADSDGTQYLRYNGGWIKPFTKLINVNSSSWVDTHILSPSENPKPDSVTDYGTIPSAVKKLIFNFSATDADKTSLGLAQFIIPTNSQLNSIVVKLDGQECYTNGMPTEVVEGQRVQISICGNNAVIALFDPPGTW